MITFNPEQALSQVTREFGEHGGVAPCLSRSSTFTVKDPATMPEIFSGLKGPDRGGYFLYSRHCNPTLDVLSRYLAAMEGTQTAQCTASGMSAIACTLLQLCRQGDHIVSSDTIYGGTHALMEQLLPQMGITASFVDPTDLSAVEAAIRPQTRVLYTEALGNPTLKVADLPAWAHLAKSRQAAFVVDNTFSPVMVSPAQHGADVVVYSLTKFINGASDLIGGAICCSDTFRRALRDLKTGRVLLLGPTMDPRAAFDLIQRLPHLPLRMREHSRRAMILAQRLHGLGLRVIYPGLATHPQHLTLTAVMNQGFGFGGMMTIDCGSRDKAEGLMSALQNHERFGLIAVSLGYYDTLMSCSGVSTASEIAPEDQARMGLGPGLVRLSIGYTGSIEDRMAQLERALAAVGMI